MSVIREEAVRLERYGDAATITLNRPDAGNTINLELARSLSRAATECASDSSIRCVVLKAAGSTFCAGGDLRLIASSSDPKALLRELAGKLHEGMLTLASMQKPLLVLVNGAAAGAGFSLAMLGDIVLAARSAHFTSAYTAIGMTPDGGLTWFLPRLIGLRRAQELIITNRRVAAPEAEAMGLVTRVIDDGQLDNEGLEVVKGLCASSATALGAARGLLAESLQSSLSAQMERELHTVSAAVASTDAREGIAAFLEKRKPEFRA